MRIGDARVSKAASLAGPARDDQARLLDLSIYRMVVIDVRDETDFEELR